MNQSEFRDLMWAKDDVDKSGGDEAFSRTKVFETPKNKESVSEFLCSNSFKESKAQSIVINKSLKDKFLSVFETGNVGIGS